MRNRGFNNSPPEKAAGPQLTWELSPASQPRQTDRQGRPNWPDSFCNEGTAGSGVLTADKSQVCSAHCSLFQAATSSQAATTCAHGCSTRNRPPAPDCCLFWQGVSCCCCFNHHHNHHYTLATLLKSAMPSACFIRASFGFIFSSVLLFVLVFLFLFEKERESGWKWVCVSAVRMECNR